MSDPPRLMNGHGTGFETYLLLAGGDERAPSTVRNNVYAAVDAALGVGVGVGVGAAVGANSSAASSGAAVSTSAGSAAAASGSAVAGSSALAGSSVLAGSSALAQGSAVVGGLVSTFLGSAAVKAVVAAAVIAGGSYGASVAVLDSMSTSSIAPAPRRVTPAPAEETRRGVTSLPAHRQGRLVAPPTAVGDVPRLEEAGDVTRVDDFESLPRVEEELDELDAPREGEAESASTPQAASAPTKAAKASSGAKRSAWRAPAPMSTSLSDELALIQRARRYLSYADHAAALRILDEYDGRYPQGTLKPEAQQLRSVVSRGQPASAPAK